MPISKGRKRCLPFSLQLGHSSWTGIALYAAAEPELFEIEGMTVANAELGAWNERERPEDCFNGGLKRFKGRQWRGWHGIRERRVGKERKRAGLRHPRRPALI